MDAALLAELSSADAMMALRAHGRGTRQLVYERAPRPVPGVGDVLVAVHAASFTPEVKVGACAECERSGRGGRAEHTDDGQSASFISVRRSIFR